MEKELRESAQKAIELAVERSAAGHSAEVCVAWGMSVFDREYKLAVDLAKVRAEKREVKQ